MSKILIVPDVHGTHEWEVAKDKISQVDYVVFLGDYFDSWENKWDDQGDNFKAICDFKRANMKKVKLLLGNHDFSYISGTRDGDKVSGHQYKKINVIRALLTSNLDIIDLAFECDGWIFSHAGFSKTWMRYLECCLHHLLDVYSDEDICGKEFASEKEYMEFIERINTPIEKWDGNFSIDLLNEVWHKRSHLPSDKNFCYEFDEVLDWHGLFNGSGDEVQQGILWIRPNSLLKDAYYDKQVVGHSEYCIHESVLLEKKGTKIYLTDSQSHSCFDVFNTNNVEIKGMNELQFGKYFKNLIKKINNLKSEFGGIELTEKLKDYKIKRITEEFGKENCEFFYKYYFND